MEKMEMAIRVGITSTVHPRYFRAGLAIAPGKSEMVVSVGQCETLEADPRLVVVRLVEDAQLPAADAPQADGDLDSAVVGMSAEQVAAPAEPVAEDATAPKGKAK